MRQVETAELEPRWKEQVERWGIRLIESIEEDGEEPRMGASYFPQIDAIIFWEPWGVTQLAHEMIHVMQVHEWRRSGMDHDSDGVEPGLLLRPDLVDAYSSEMLDVLRDFGYPEEALLLEAEAYTFQCQPDLVVALLETLEPFKDAA